MSGASPPAGQELQGSRLPARLRIVGWIVLATGLCLAAVVLTVRNTLLAEVDREGNSEVEQEAEEFRTFAETGVNPETAEPFASTRALLGVHLDRQFPEEDEVLLGIVRPEGSDLDTLTQARTGPYELAEDTDLLRAILDSEEAAGVLETPAGTMRWGRVDVPPVSADDDPGSFVSAEFTQSSADQVDDVTELTVLISSGGLVLAAGIAWAVGGQILAPVRTVRRAAARITEHDLTSRIPVQGRDDVAALAETFNQMLDRLDSAFRSQQAFAGETLRRLRGPVDRLQREVGRLAADDASAAELPRLQAETRLLASTLGDLEVLAAAIRPEFVEREQVDLAGLTDRLLTVARRERSHRFDVVETAEGTGYLDLNRVLLAWEQLVENAVQHSPADRHVRVGTRVEDRRGPVLRVWVADEGPGLDADDARRAFDSSIASRQAGDGKAGLGLAIVRAVADAHDGSAFVESTPGEGAVFGMLLPLRGPDGAR